MAKDAQQQKIEELEKQIEQERREGTIREVNLTTRLNNAGCEIQRLDMTLQIIFTLTSKL